MSALPLPDLLRTANDALDAARHLVLRRAPEHITSKADRDLVSNIDIVVEREVRGLLRERTSEIAFLGEEEGWSNGIDSDSFWVLDPVDGTSNLIKMLPLVAVSLALVRSERTLVGAVDLPFLDLRYTAMVGEGAFRSGGALRASQVHRLSDAIVSIGDYAVGEAAATKNPLRFAVTKKLAMSVQRVRMLGSAAIDLVWVAEGRLDACVMLSNKPWDTAAGVLIAREAGAKVLDANGQEHTLRSDSTVAAAAPLAHALADLVKGTHAHP
ncbi:MAG TPA: inositol monophosphatase family protein [Acidimicrobiales bacterium]|nr:inositol monophosphatase family protein [Acidimicrobiales bacterium]